MAGTPDGMAAPPENRSDAARRSVAFGRLRMRVNLSLGRLITLSAPLLGVIALYLSFSWFGLFRIVPDWLRLTLLGLFAIGLLASLWPLTRFRAPGRSEIDSRLEVENRIANQAITTQDDRIEAADPFARALWEEHRRRMAQKIGTLETGVPRSSLPAQDPWGLRVAAGLLLFVAFGYSFSGNSGRPGDAFVSHVSSDLPDVRIDAWITPPPYVNQAPVFLTGVTRSEGAVVDAIEGSEITIRVGGSGADAQVMWGPDQASLAPLEQTDEAAETATVAPANGSTWTFKPAADGNLTINAGRSGAEFAIRVIADEPPVAAFIETPRRAANGALELEYTLTDDHGVAKAEAEIVPAEEASPDARPLFDPPQYRLSLPRRSSPDNRAIASHDLTEHPLAGQKVRITLVATDGAGQEGRSETLETVLPGRRFSEPLAAAVVEQRGVLALDANNLTRVFDLHDALTIAPDETIPNLTHYLLLQSVRGRLENARSDEDLRAAIDYMWGVALQLEDSNLSLAERRLRDAQNALAEALENGATDEEISQLMDELREAMQDYLRELARQNPANQNAENQAMPQNTLRQRDLDNMLDQIENLARSGARDQAQQMLQELQRMMNNLQAGRQQQQQQQGGPMREQMDKLGELMRQQQQLMDETMRADRNQQGQPGEGRDRQQQGQQQPGEGQDQGQQGQGDQSLEDMLGALGRSQQELRDALGQLQSELEALGIDPSEGFGEAGEAMGDATGNLEQGETGQALGDQGRALQALRQGAEDMMNQMMQAMGEQPGEGEGQGPDRNGNRSADDRDPLGRPRATTGPDFGSRVKVPDEIDIQRAREILDAIRKRLGDQLSPDIEKRYLERLLDLQ